LRQGKIGFADLGECGTGGGIQNKAAAG